MGTRVGICGAGQNTSMCWSQHHKPRARRRMLVINGKKGATRPHRWRKSYSYCWQCQKEHKELKLYGLFIFKHTHCNGRLIKRIHFHPVQDLLTAALSWLCTAHVFSIWERDQLHMKTNHGKLKRVNVNQVSDSTTEKLNQMRGHRDQLNKAPGLKLASPWTLDLFMYSTTAVQM